MAQLETTRSFLIVAMTLFMVMPAMTGCAAVMATTFGLRVTQATTPYWAEVATISYGVMKATIRLMVVKEMPWSANSLAAQLVHASSAAFDAT
mgnify:CR=1 FL=1